MLYAAAWIVGEFSEHLTDSSATLDSLLNPKVTALPPHIQAIFIQNIVKLYASFLVKAEAEVHKRRRKEENILFICLFLFVCLFVLWSGFY